MTRKDFVSITIMAVVALSGAFLLGDAFQARTVKPQDRYAFRPSVPLDHMAPSGNAVTAESTPRARAAVEFEVSDAITGERMEVGTTIEVADLAGNLLTVLRGSREGEAIVLDSPIGLPVRVRASGIGASGVIVGPIVPVLGACQMVPIRLARHRWLEVQVQKERREVSCVMLFSAAPPLWPETAPFLLREYVPDGQCRFLVPPGQYWCAVADQTVWSRFPARSDAFSMGGPAWLGSLTVAAEDLAITARVEADPGTCAIEVAAAGLTTDSDVTLDVFACGPGPLRRQFASVKQGAAGTFKVEGLPPGLTHLAFTGAEEATDRWVTLSQGERRKLDVQLKRRSYRLNQLVSGPRVGRIKLAREGVALSGVSVVLEGVGVRSYNSRDGVFRVFGKTDADGSVLAKDWVAGDYRVLPDGPYCLKEVVVAYAPGSPGEVLCEIQPGGTGALAVRNAGRPEKYWDLVLRTGDGKRLDSYYTQNSSIEICGVEPGTYQLSYTDDRNLEHQREVLVAAGKATEVEYPFATRTVAGAWLWPGPPPDGTRFGVGLRNSEGGSDVNWQESWRRLVDIDASGFKFTAAPTSAMRLFVAHDELIQAVAEVAAGAQDLTQVAWTALRYPDGLTAGALTVEGYADSGKPPRVSMELCREGVPWTAFGGGAMRVESGRFRFTFSGIAPGRWNARIRVNRHVMAPVINDLPWPPVEIELNAAGGASTTVQLEIPRLPVRKSDLSREFLKTPIWWMIAEPQVLQPMPHPPMPERVLLQADRFDYAAVNQCVELHVAGADLANLWQAELHYRRGGRLERAVVGPQGVEDRVVLVQVQGRPLILWPSGAGDPVRVLLVVPGCKPVPIDLAPGQRRIAVTLQPE